MQPKMFIAFGYALGYAVGSLLFGLAVALAFFPEGMTYIPLFTSSIGWMYGFKTGTNLYRVIPPNTTRVLRRGMEDDGWHPIPDKEV